METKIRESQNNQFLQAGEAGRHSWWRYLATLMVIVFAVITFNVIASVIVVAITGTSDIHSMPVEWVFILAMSTFPPAVLALLFCLKSIHKRSVRTLVTPHLKPNWKWFWISGSIWLGLNILGEIFLAFVVTPGNYQFIFNPDRFFRFAFLAICLLPIQTTTEELLFRGYLLQGISLLSKHIWIAVLATSLTFALLHGANPEVARYGFWTMMSFYAGIGLLLAWVTLYTEGLEAALGLHLANNIYAALLVTFPGSALPSPAIFSLKEYHPSISLLLFLILAVVYGITIRIIKRKWLRHN